MLSNSEARAIHPLIFECVSSWNIYHPPRFSTPSTECTTDKEEMQSCPLLAIKQVIAIVFYRVREMVTLTASASIARSFAWVHLPQPLACGEEKITVIHPWGWDIYFPLQAQGGMKYELSGILVQLGSILWQEHGVLLYVILDWPPTEEGVSANILFIMHHY